MGTTNLIEKKKILKSIIHGNFTEVGRLKKLLKKENFPIIVLKRGKGFCIGTERNERIISDKEVEELKKENSIEIITLIEVETKESDVSYSEQEIRDREGL
jgi:hypothetical protein